MEKKLRFNLICINSFLRAFGEENDIPYGLCEGRFIDFIVDKILFDPVFVDMAKRAIKEETND
jgi:hypothetical protein